MHGFIRLVRAHRILAASLGLAVSLTLGGGLAAAAATTASVTGKGACVQNDRNSFTTSRWWLHGSPAVCPAGWSWWPNGPSSGGAQGPQGPQGLPGTNGTNGTNATTSTKTYDLGGAGSVPTGGSFVADATEIGTVTLGAGTYLIDVNAKATPPSGGTGAVETFPQFFVYNQAKNAAFTGDLFNVGAGALESGTHATIDSYYSGSDIIVVPADGETLHLLAFGYDSDQSAGSYVLDNLTVTATLLTTS
jgi:hypothetical protein